MNSRPNACRCDRNQVCRCPRPRSPKSCRCRPKFCCPCPPELRGVTAQLRVANEVYLEDGQEVIFDIILRRNTRDITYNSNSGRFCLREGSTYLINWDVAVEGSYYRPFVRFSLIAGGNVIGSSTMPVTVGQLSGTSLLTVTNSPIELSLINDTDDIVGLSGFTPVANITITKVSNTFR